MAGATVRSGSGTDWVRYAARPALILAILIGLAVWLGAVELDSIEARRLNTSTFINETLRHIQLVVVSTVIVISLAIPAGIALTRPTRLAKVSGPPILAIANAGQSVPSIGILVLIAVFLGQPSIQAQFGIAPFGFWPTIIALVLYAFLPVLRNTMVGIEQVDESIVEAAYGMGMSPRQVLRQIELPLAVPVMLAGIRTALVINVGTATVATLVNSGGLGDVVYFGIIQSRTNAIWAGALLVAVLALTIDYLAGIAEDKLRPKGI